MINILPVVMFLVMLSRLNENGLIFIHGTWCNMVPGWVVVGGGGGGGGEPYKGVRSRHI